jgi:4-hydroxyphenylacetate 3-hydroxylase N terminal
LNLVRRITPGLSEHSFVTSVSPAFANDPVFRPGVYTGNRDRRIGAPHDGEEYIESIRDGREVYLYGDRIKDVTTHPAFRHSVWMTARRYDALHDRKTRDVPTCPTDTGNGGYMMRFYQAAHSAKDLVADRDAIAAWARLTYGWMGRSPDYKASFLGTLGARCSRLARRGTWRSPRPTRCSRR